MLLRNPIYTGSIAHKGELYLGQHKPIVSKETWEEAQELLRTNGYSTSNHRPAPEKKLLAGLLFDEQGDRLVPVRAKKNEKIYDYYVSSRLSRRQRSDHHALRLAAIKIEDLVRHELAKWFADTKGVLKACDAQCHSVDFQRALSEWAQKASGRIQGETIGGAEQMDLVRQLVRRVTVHADRTSIQLTLLPIIESIAGVHEDASSASGPARAHMIEVPIRFGRRGKAARLILNDQHRGNAKPNMALIKLMATAHRRFDALISGTAASPGELAKQENTDPSELSRSLQLACLAPDIIQAILEGTQPESLTALRLKKLRDLPLSWQDQRELLGFSS